MKNRRASMHNYDSLELSMQLISKNRSAAIKPSMDDGVNSSAGHGRVE
jgi:hypothetical protein